MNLLNLTPETRTTFSNSVKTLVEKHQLAPNEIFLNVLESDENPDMNYWMTLVLVQEHGVNPQQEVGRDKANEMVKPLQAACLLRNPGMVAALLELKAFQGSLTDREFLISARMASGLEDQDILALMMRYAQEMSNLEALMSALKNEPIQSPFNNVISK